MEDKTFSCRKNNPMAKKAATIPYDFVLEQLWQAEPVVKPMFGCHAVYIGEKIFFILRKKEDHTEDNGVWIATTPEHHESLRKDFPVMRSIRAFGEGVTGWQVLPEDGPAFEESVMLACELALKGDRRLGKFPKPKKPKRK
jgi:hypothetical protein